MCEHERVELGYISVGEIDVDVDRDCLVCV